MNDIVDSISRLPGFKISKSHFRIGSKIHISDFYYAKRFFQNSFFSSRLAFIIADDIRKATSPDQLSAYKEHGFSLVGYGIYSELLLSLVEKFLRARWSMPREKLNHNLVLDSESFKLVKQNNLHAQMIIIVPIASTFGTAIKIEEQLRKLVEEPLFPLAHINVLYISDLPQAGLTKVEDELGWTDKKPDDKTVEMTAYFEGGGGSKTQQYYLSLSSQWHSVDDCLLCFPKNEAGEEVLCEELPLFETDRTAVTPALLFNLPFGRFISADDRNRAYVLSADLVQYGHHTRNKSHFLFSIKTEEFLIENEIRVVDWLRQNKDALLKRLEIEESSHVLLVSSCHYSNALFINLVNEYLFFSAANIIHYDPTNDYIQNFEMMYGEEIKNADKIIFVDDALKSGSNFSKIYDFIDYTIHQGGEPKGKGIAACIMLVNLAQDFTVSAIQRKLLYDDAIVAFANLHLYTSLTHEEESPLLIEEQRYAALVNDSFLDSLKTHFFRQAGKLAEGEHPEPDDIKKQRHLNMLEATHRVYQYFSGGDTARFPTLYFEGFRDAVFARDIILHGFAGYPPEPDSELSPREAALLKVLSQSPFVQYEPLRKKVFQWVLGLLEKQLGKVRTAIKEGTFGYGLFEDLKFYMRRAGLLNSNYLISDSMFRFLVNLYQPEGIPGLIQKIEADINGSGGELFSDQDKTYFKHKLENLNAFAIFYSAQIKELLLRNETRSILLEKRLKDFTGKHEGGFDQLIRILWTENSVLLQKFYQFLEQQPNWKTLYADKKVNETYKPITDYLEAIAASNHLKYKSLEKFLNTDPEKVIVHPFEQETFLIYIWVLFFINSEKTDLRILLEQKTELIFKKLKRLFTAANQVTDQVGAFFLVKSSPRSKPQIVYDKNAQGTGVLDADNLLDNNPLLREFLNGTPDRSNTYHKSIIEYARNEGHRTWSDLYAVDQKQTVKGLDWDILPKKNSDRLILVRLNKRVNERDEKPQGLIGFYFTPLNPLGKTITGMDVVRFLHLLRTPLSRFVEDHHENNEFRDWQVTEATRRFMLLSGHGKEMLRLLSDDERYLNIAEHLEFLQMVIMVNKSVADYGGDDDIKKRFNEFYHVAGEKQINPTSFRELVEMAQDIYNRQEVEDAVDCQVDGDFEGEGLPFAFNNNILILICFELFVNAKKNRWHFLPGEQVGEFLRNELTIRGSVQQPGNGKNKLKIIVSNIGPEMDEDELKLLKNQNKNVKADDAVAGTALLKALIYKYLGGRIEFDSEPLVPAEKLARFTVTLTLPEMT